MNDGLKNFKDLLHLAYSILYMRKNLGRDLNLGRFHHLTDVGRLGRAKILRSSKILATHTPVCTYSNND